MRDRMLAGELYIGADAVLQQEYQHAQALVEAFNRTPASMPAERRRVLSELLGGFGDDSEIRPPFSCDYGYQISVGSRTFINYGCTCLDVAGVAR